MTTQIETMTLSETEMKNLVRNALIIAGKEMGEDGDHWPVIKNTIKDVMRDWEDLEIERAVHAELKIHMKDLIHEMQEAALKCEPDLREKALPFIQQMKEHYDAFFSDVENDVVFLTDDEEEEIYFASNEDIPIHLRRADRIIDTLFEEK